MTVFDRRFLYLAIAILFTGLVAGHVYGSQLAKQNPDGILLHTPHPDELDPGTPAYPIGFGIAVFVVGALTVLPSLLLAAATRVWLRGANQFWTQFLLAGIFSSLVFFVAALLIESASAN